MEKYGVVTDVEAYKSAAAGSGTCPKCGGHNVDYRGTVPKCGQCGTRPWEKAPSEGSEDEEDSGGRRPSGGKGTY